MSLCFFHGDLDGHTSAAIIDKRFHIDKFVVADYDMQFPFDEISKDEAVYIVDFSLKDKETLNRLLSITKKVVWIDHHITAIQKFKGYENIEGMRADTYPAACLLCWKFCYPLVDPPTFVSLVSDYDTWKYEFGDMTRNLVTAAQNMENTYPLNRDFWRLVLDNDQKIIEDMGDNGKKIRQKLENERKNYAKNYAFSIDFEGLKTIACNKRDGGSLLFENLEDISCFDIMLSFQYNGRSKLWEFSLYSTNSEVDCSEIAKKYGGGGHPGAAGFSLDYLPFELGRSK